MASSSGGKGKKPHSTVEAFSFVTKLEASISDKDDEDVDDELEDQQQLELCLANTQDVNKFLDLTVSFTGITEGFLKWAASSEKGVTHFIKAVKEKKVQKKLTKYLGQTNLKERLKLESGKSIDIDVMIENRTQLKKEAKSHFAGKICTPELTQDDPQVNPTTAATPASGNQSTSLQGESPKVGGSEYHAKHQAMETQPPLAMESEKGQPDGEMKGSQKDESPKVGGSEYHAKHQAMETQPPLAVEVQPVGEMKQKGESPKVGGSEYHAKQQATEIQPPLAVEVQPVGEMKQKESFNPNKESYKEQKGNDSSVDKTTAYEGCPTASSTNRGSNYERDKHTTVALYVAEDKCAHTVKMEYGIGEYKTGMKTVKMKYNEHYNLWFSKEIFYPSNTSLSYAFDVFKWRDVLNPSFRDNCFRKNITFSPLIRVTFGDSECLVDSYATHVLHIIAENKDLPISWDLAEIDRLTKGFYFTKEKKMLIFCKLIRKTDFVPLRYPKALAVIGYIFGKLDIQFTSLQDYSSEFISESALKILESLVTVNQQNVTKTQLMSFQHCAVQMCKRAFPKSACLLLMMKYCFSFFSSTYFRQLHTDKVFKFSSGETENDTDLQLELFHKLAWTVQQGKDTDMDYLFGLLVEDTPLNQSLKFDYERYPQLVKRVDHLLEGQIAVAISGLRSTTMKWADFEQLCSGISKHPSLVKRHSPDLTKLGLQCLRVGAYRTTVTDAQLKIFDSPALFTEEQDRQTLLLILSKSECPRIHGFYLTKLDYVITENSSAITESALAWMDVLINRLKKNVRDKTPVNDISVLYEQLQKILRTKKVSRDEELIKSLKDKVCKAVSDMDLEMVLNKCIERGFTVDPLFFHHLQEIADQEYKGQEILSIMERILNPNTKASVSWLKIVELGLWILQKKLTGKAEDRLFVMVEHWKLCLCAVKNSSVTPIKGNAVYESIAEQINFYWKLFQSGGIEVFVIKRLDKLCKKSNYIPLDLLFRSFHPWIRDSVVVQNMKHYLKSVEDAGAEAMSVISTLQVISEHSDTCRLPGLSQVIKYMQGKIKDLEIGREIQIQLILDRSYFGYCKLLLSQCSPNQYLWKSQIFLKLFTVSEHESPLEGEAECLVAALHVLMKNTEKFYKEYWQMVCADTSILVSKLHIVSGSILMDEIQIAEKAMSNKVPALVKDALQLVGDYQEYMRKTHVLKDTFDVLDLDANKDSHFTNAVSAFTGIEKHKDSLTLQNLVVASQDFKEIDEMLDSSTVDMLEEFSKSKNLIDFIKEIQHEDLRNLIDAVEEHSEQSVQEITVSSLIDVRRFLRPLLEEDLPSSVLELLGLMHKFIAENKLTGLATKLLECNNSLHSLRSLYHNVANRGEVTKDIVKALLEDEDANVSFDVDENRKVCLLLKYKGNKILNSNELSDYRSRALLLVSTESQDENEDSETEIMKFVGYVDSAIAIAGLYEQLVSSGYPELEMTMSVRRHQLLHRENILRNALSGWIKTLEEARGKWYWLNHFYPEQIKKLKLFLSNGRNKDEIIPVFQSAGCNPVNLDQAQILYAYITNSTKDKDDEFCLKAVGATLDELLKQDIAVGQHFPEDGEFAPKHIRPFDRVQDGELFVISLPENSAYVIPALMTLYRNTTGHIPSHHQVLFCSESTTSESVQLLLNKSVGGKVKGLPKQLYCIVNVEKLKNEEQFKLVYKLKELGSKIQYLAVICKGSTNHPLINHFSENVHKFKPMLDKAISNCFRRLWPDINVVTSDLPGQGKTEMVQYEAFRKKLDIVTFHVSGHVSEMSMTSRLKQLPIESESLLHLDIGNLSNGEEVDIILFKLCILGFLSDGPHIFSCPTKHISIEIANSISGTLENSLPTLKYFEPVKVCWQGFRNLRVSQEINSPLQVVCHYLLELSQGTLDEKDLYFTGETVVKPIPDDQCRDLLRKQFGAVGDLSFSVLNILLNVLSDQLKKMSCSLFLRTSSLASMIGTNTVKSSLLKAILAVSTEFATRSVTTCREEQTQTLTTESKQKRSDVIKGRETMETASATAMTERVKGMIQWEESNHLVITFHNQDIQTFSALYRDHDRVPEHVKKLFETQMNKPLPDFSKVTDSDLKERLQHIARFKLDSLPEEKLKKINASYAITPDNLLKMILIIMRVKSHIPVIIMGETGCGKTSLLRYLANICDIHFQVKNMHAGINEEDVIESVKRASSLASENFKEYVWLFFDEINTCDHLGLLNDLLCHHVFNGQCLPPNLTILAACNPYKLRNVTNIFTAGLSTKVKTDEQSRLVYRVHPLPERMVDYVWDFGSLTDSDEKAYISSMVARSLNCLKDELLVELLVMSQAFIRHVEKSPYCVSLRDVNRCRLLVPWFRDELLPEISSQKSRDMKEAEAVIMALAHSYHSRLNQMLDREKYRDNIADLLKKYEVTSHYSCECNGEFVFNIIQKNQSAILNKMDMPDGIARNTALQENVFVILVCMLKHLPIFVVGKPGCSKSLSLQLLKSNLRGKDSRDEYFKKLPQLYYVSFQGSESSTSDGILKVFQKAQNYRQHNKEEDVLPVVILDEIGLAEISAYNPLKVLHSLLEPENKEFPDVAVVGISNWSLDAAKMNRAIHLSRPDMDAEELHATAVSIAESNNENSMSITFTQTSDKRTLSYDDKNTLKALAYAYFEYVKNQKIKNFHGLRDFYSLIKFISKMCRSGASGRSEKCLFVLNGLLRNFGGLESEIKYVVKTFNIYLDKMMTHLPPLDLSDKSVPSLLELIGDNIKDENARHLMLLTRGGSSLGIVEELLRSSGRQYMTIQGSHFKEDQTDHYSYRVLSRIILCMEQGIILILKDLDTIYGSLYDMLNQNYTVVGKKKNCRIALGAYSNPLCRVEDNFRCIVLVEENKVNFSDPPFLNRFEKQRLVISDVLQPEMKQLVDKLQGEIEDISKVSGYESISPKELVPIYNSDMIPSLVHSQYNSVQKKSANAEEVEQECLQKIIALCTPEGMIRAEKSSLMTKEMNFVKSMKEQYFSLPIHDGLESYLTNLLTSSENGIATMIFTHSSIYVDLQTMMTTISDSSQFEKLGSFKSEKQLSSSIKKFWTDPRHTWLFIQVSHTDQQHFLLMKSILEHERKQHLSSTEDMTVIKHVVVIIHIDRTEEGGQMCLVDFLSGWQMAMIDCLDIHTDQLKRLLNGTLSDLAKSLLHEKGISHQDLFGAFTCIHYTEMSRPLESIQAVITSMCENETLLSVILELVENWIGEMESVRSNQDWQLEVACNTVKLKNFLTYHGALLEEVKSKLRHPLAAVVFKVEEFNGWDYLASEGSQGWVNEKMAFWQSLMKNRHILDISKVPEPKGPECYPCRLTTLQTRFPFSSYFIHNIEDLQRTFSDILRAKQLDSNDGKIEEATYEPLYKLFCRSVNSVATEMFDYNYGKVQFDDYFYDYCQWFTAELPLTMSEDQRIDVIGQAIKSRISLEEDQFNMFVTKLHVTGWMYKYKLQSEIILIDTCLSQLSVSLTDILKRTYTAKKETLKRKLDRESGMNGPIGKQEVVSQLRHPDDKIRRSGETVVKRHSQEIESGERPDEANEVSMVNEDSFTFEASKTRVRRHSNLRYPSDTADADKEDDVALANRREFERVSERHCPEDEKCSYDKMIEADVGNEETVVEPSDTLTVHDGKQEPDNEIVEGIINTRQGEVQNIIEGSESRENRLDEKDTVTPESIAAEVETDVSKITEDGSQKKTLESERDLELSDERITDDSDNSTDREDDIKTKIRNYNEETTKGEDHPTNDAAADVSKFEKTRELISDAEDNKKSKDNVDNNGVDGISDANVMISQENDQVIQPDSEVIQKPEQTLADQLSVSDESNKPSEEREDELECEDEVASTLVEVVCHYLIPSKEVKDKSVTAWQCMVNLVLSLTTDVSVQPVILETLRACNDFASMIILPHSIDEKYFWEMGDLLSSGNLDSEEIVSFLKQFVMDVKHIPAQVQHFLSSYTSCCLMADTESNFVSKMFEINMCLTGNINNVQFMGSVLHHAMFLQSDNNPKELLEAEGLDNDFFTMLDEYLARSQEGDSISYFACVLVDVLQNHIFSKTYAELEDDPHGFLGNILELKRKYTCEESLAVKSVVIIGYLKACLRSLALYVCKLSLSDSIWQKINQIFEDGKLEVSSRAQGIQAYFLKCLITGGGQQACAEMKRRMLDHLELISSLEITSSKKLNSLEQNPLLHGCTQSYFEVCKAVESLCEGNSNPLLDLIEHTTEEEDNIYGLFAFSFHEFHLIKAVRNMKGIEGELSRNLVKEIGPKMPCHQTRLLSRLCQQEEFGMDFLQLQAQSSAEEYHIVACVIDIVSTIFAVVRNLDSGEPKHIFLDCICDPLTAAKRPMPGQPDRTAEVHSFTWQLSPLRTILCIYNCACGCRLLFMEDSGFSVCPSCKKALAKERLSQHSSDMFDEEKVDSSELLDAESSSLGDTMDLDSNTTTDSAGIQGGHYSNTQLSCLETVRSLTQVSYRIVQFIYLSCLTGGVALNYSTNVELQSVLHLNDKTDLEKDMHVQLSNQWNYLKTLLSMGDEQLGRFLHIVFLEARNLLTRSDWHISTKEERAEFEKEFTELVSPLVRSRFQLIMDQVKKFSEVCSEEKGFLEDLFCEVIEETNSVESLQHLWREVTQPSTENMKMEFLLTESQEKFPILSLVFGYEQELKLTKHIWSVLQWHICTVKHISYRYKKRECRNKTLSEFKHSLRDDGKISEEVKQAWEVFSESWEEITSMKQVIARYIEDYDVGHLDNFHPHIELEKCIVMDTQSQVFKVLQALVRMQNCFLDEAMKSTLLNQVFSSSFLMRSNSHATVPVVKVEDITKHQLITSPDYDNLLKFSQCNTTCGHGREVVYDYYQIERDVSLQCLLKKAHIHISDSFPKIAFAGEIQHTVSTLLQEIKQLLQQEPLSSETEMQLNKMDASNRRVLMSYLEMTFCLLKRMSVSASDKKQVLGDFLESWQNLFPYRVQDVDNFCSTVCLCNTVALYELVEKHMAADVVESLEDKFRITIPPDAQSLLAGNEFDNTEYLDAMVTALSKYAYRYLQSSDIDPDDQLLVVLKDPSLWPERILDQMQTESRSILPPSICVKHIFKTVKHIKSQIEKLQEKAKCEVIQQKKKKETKAKKSKTWKR